MTNHHNDKTIFGFWVYMMTDLVMFAALFASFAVLRDSIYGGPSGRELFSLQFVLIETLILLTSSFTCGLAMMAVRDGKKNQSLVWFSITFLLGLSFLGMELKEFSSLIAEGNGFTRSAFLSSFFTLVGTHGLHITVGLIWIATLLFKVWQRGLESLNTLRQLTLLSLFWHFLDIVWIFIFTFVYLMGATR